METALQDCRCALAILIAAVLPCVPSARAADAGAASGSALRFEPLYEIPFTGRGMPMTMRRDTSGRPWLYVAAKEAGLLIYDVSAAPRLLRMLPAAAFEGLDVMSLAQAGGRLYLALGNHWGRVEYAGVAVVDVGPAGAPRVLGVWKDTQSGGAGGAVVVDGGNVYLAAMGAGLVVLDVRDPGAMRVQARLQPVPDFPDAQPDPRKLNARGLAFRDSLLFLCFDAGGVRVLDVKNPAQPLEIGRYSNPVMKGLPRAYNNLVLHGDLACVAADYMGLEIIDISNPRKPVLRGWWNPWNPAREPWRWLSSPGHANEIEWDVKNRLVFLSAGRSDLVAVDVSDSTRPRQAGVIGQVEDAQATWGVSRHEDQLYLAYIRTPGIPFRADWSGVKAYRYRR